jgi:two-component sensor histidine kinase
MVHVPYKGATPAISDIIAGHIEVYFGAMVSTLPHARSGRLRALGVTSLKRVDAAKDIPTLDEQGLKGYETGSWFGMAVPTGTPQAIITKLHAESVKALQAPDLRDRTAGDIAAGISVGIRHLHQMTEELLPIHVQGLSLATALRQLELMAQTAYRLRTTFTIPESPKLDPTTAEAIYRAAREAVTNAGCHAGGRNLRLTLEQSPGRAELTVEDDGTGFVPAERIARNHGLQYLRDRIEWLGGNVVIESKPGSGTRIAVVLPSPASDTEAGRRPRSGEGSGRASLR